MRNLLPVSRWALTPPFHHHPHKSAGSLFSVALSVTPKGAPGYYPAFFPAEPGLSSPGKNFIIPARRDHLSFLITNK